MKLRLRTFGPATAFFCEFLGLAALALTPEVERPLFLAPIVIGILAGLLRAKLPDRLLLFLVAALVVGGYAAAGGAPTGTLVARALIPAHALLWLAADERVYRFWRLGVAMVELVLAAILSPEAHMFVLIFLFVLVSSLALSLGFLERRFHARDPESLERPLRPSFVLAVLALSCVIFLSSLLIFPILPRSRWNGGGGDTSAGYTDVVNFQQGILNWARQDSRPALWLFRNDSRGWESIVPGFLLRGQALESFNGQEWRARPGKAGKLQGEPKVEGTVEIRRQPFPTDVLPVPYGTLEVSSGSEFPIARMAASTWLAHGSHFHPISYEATYGAFRRDDNGASGDTLQFSAQIFPEIAKFARELAKGASTPEERINRVQKLFAGGDFAYELRPVESYRPGHVHPLEDFLFRNKRGHCELFASSAALLLRAMGVPARLAVGFRVRPPRRGNVLTVRASDAHAWTEAWTATRGWRAIDPTPAYEETGWVSDTFGEMYDWIGAYWNRYILEYELDSDSLFALLRPVFGFLALLSLAAGLLLYWRRRKGKGPNSRDRLARVLHRFEDDLVHRAGVYPEQAYRLNKDALEWKRRYTQLRFGRQEPSPDDISRMRQQAARIVESAILVPAQSTVG